jgi:hypothetical protein
LVALAHDIAVATHGRGFWILDDIEPLRQAREVHDAAHLFKPQRAWRFRWNKNTDTPLPQDEPAGQNPPDGAIIDYWLPASAASVALEILDTDGNLVRRYSHDDPIAAIVDTGNVPASWIRPQRVLSTRPGMHRFVWDLYYPPVPAKPTSYPIAAIAHDTPPSPSSPLAMPGNYTARVTVDGRVLTQPLTLTMDPRVTTSREGLAQQFAASMKVYARLREKPEDETLRSLLDRLQDADTAPSEQLMRAVEEVTRNTP